MSQSCSGCFNSVSLPDTFGTSASNNRQRYRQRTAQDWRPSRSPSRLSASAVPGSCGFDKMAIAEARWRSLSSCASRPVKTMSRIGLYGHGLSSRGSPCGIARQRGAGGEWAGLQTHRDDLTVGDVGKYVRRLCLGLRYPFCSDCNCFRGAIGWCHRLQTLLHEAFVAWLHFPELVTDLLHLTRVHHEASLCFSSVGLRVSTALSTPQKRSSMTRRCWVGLRGLGVLTEGLFYLIRLR